MSKGHTRLIDLWLMEVWQGQGFLSGYYQIGENNQGCLISDFLALTLFLFRDILLGDLGA